MQEALRQLEETTLSDDCSLEAMLESEVSASSRQEPRSRQLLAILALSNRRPVDAEPLYETEGGDLCRQLSWPDTFFQVRV